PTRPVTAGAAPPEARPALQPGTPRESPMLLAFYLSNSALEREAVTRLEHHPALGSARGVPLESVAAPAARQFHVTETPTLLLYGPDGKLVLRCSRPEEVERALGPRRSSETAASGRAF